MRGIPHRSAKRTRHAAGRHGSAHALPPCRRTTRGKSQAPNRRRRQRLRWSTWWNFWKMRSEVGVDGPPAASWTDTISWLAWPPRAGVRRFPGGVCWRHSRGDCRGLARSRRHRFSPAVASRGLHIRRCAVRRSVSRLTPSSRSRDRRPIAIDGDGARIGRVSAAALATASDISRG